MRRTHILALSAALLMTGAACSSNDDNADSGVGGPDSGIVDTSTVPDAGASDADIPDTGPLPCMMDQGGEDNRGCEPGFVCNLAMDPPECVQGKTCTQNSDCNPCSAFQNAEDCGHGYKLNAWCDPNHGDVCVRSRAPCEPCETDEDCGRNHPNLTLGDNQCLDYGNGEKFCGRPCTLGCPNGFVCDATTQQCKREQGCDPEPTICPSGPCPPGSDQVCAGEECPGTGGASCSTNDQPGSLGICIGFCRDNSDCPANLPICRQTNGICVAGCTQGSCPLDQVCHLDGECGLPCADNAECEERFDENAYCNKPGQPPPRLYKPSYRDVDSCAPLGCERPVDCGQGVVCDDIQAPPACVPGCFNAADDCLSGEVCKSGPQGSYTRSECRALPEKTDESEIGVCCFPGCTNRVLQCGINEFCCGEPGSPYEEAATCLTSSASAGMSEPGECFPMGADPFCQTCGEMGDPPCDSGWAFGFNTDPAFNGGQPFQEQELCTPIAMGGPNICTVTCNPEALDPGCPRGWPCRKIRSLCFEDGDCGGLPCVGADQMNNVPGKCQCGTSGNIDTPCMPVQGLMPEVPQFPRCVDEGTGDMFCLYTYTCVPPSLREDPPNYPESCGF